MTCLLAWGSSEHGQFASDDKKAEHRTPVVIDFFLRSDIKLVQVACGLMHTLVLSDDGRVYSFGCNAGGQLGRSGEGS